MSELIQKIAVFALPVILAITLHEAAHGYVARLFGDATAYLQGRVTLNPFKHIDPIGTVLLPLLLMLLPLGFLFGYAKPVPVAFENLRNPKRDMIWVALAGPAANLVQALLWLLFGIALRKLDVHEVFFYALVQAGVVVNCVIFAVNLMPIPPLDGGRVVIGLLPDRASRAYSRLEPYGFFLVLALVVVPGALNAWIQPIVGVVEGLLGLVVQPLL
jgi:Zn-dependent protease